MKTSYIVSVTYSEFMAWYASGELRLSRNRLIKVPLDESGKPIPDQLRVQTIMDLLPYVDLENEHTILIVQLDKGISDNQDGIPLKTGELRAVIYLPFHCIQRLFPLTQRGSNLMSRLDNYYVKLNEPLLEKQASHLLEQWSKRSSLRGASALVSIIVANSDFEPKDYEDVAFKALNLANHSKKFPLNSHGLLASVFSYDRHDSVPDEDVGFVIDLGVILGKFFSSNDKVKTSIGQLRTFCKSREHKRLGLAEIFSNSEFNHFVRDMQQFIPGKVRLESFILFLKWKYDSQRKDCLNIEKLMDDVRQCAGKIEKNSIEQALWLFGYFWGFNRLADEYYARQSSRFPFITRKIPHDPCVLPKEVVIAKEPQEIEKSTQSTDKQETSERSASEEKLENTDVSPATVDDAKESQKAEELAQPTDKKKAPEMSASKEKSQNTAGSPAAVEEQEASEIAQDDQKKSQCEGDGMAVQASLLPPPPAKGGDIS